MFKSTSPLLFSPDEEDGSTYETSEVLHFCKNDCIVSENDHLTNETLLVDKFGLLMNGLPPPPSLAVCYLTCDEILTRYNANKNSILPSVPKCSKNHKNERHIFSSLNCGEVSEKLAILMQRVQRRFIQRETMSTCNIWFKELVPLTASAKKLKRDIHSPGRRLSHLARRRQVFSKDNLQQLAQSDRNTLEIRTNKPAPLRQQHQLKLYQKDNQQQVPRRALFQSPEQHLDEELSRPGYRTVPRQPFRRRLFNQPRQSKSSTDDVDCGGYDVSGWLRSQDFTAVVVDSDNDCCHERNRKRPRRSDTDESSGQPLRKKKCPRRSLTFDDDDDGSSSISSHTRIIEQSQLRPTLNELHKKKLLWAVSRALTEKNIFQKDPNFRSYASRLFSLCKKNLPEILSSSSETSTSDKMLNYARQHLSNVIPNVTQPQPDTDGEKENLKTPPKRPLRDRKWRTCMKNLGKKRRLFRSRSVGFDDEESLMPLERVLVLGSQDMGDDLKYPALRSKSFDDMQVPDQHFNLILETSKKKGSGLCTYIESSIESNLTINHETSQYTIHIDETILGTVDVSLLSSITKPSNYRNFLKLNEENEEQTQELSDSKNKENDEKEDERDDDQIALNTQTVEKREQNLTNVKEETDNVKTVISTPIIMKRNSNWKVIQSPNELKLKMCFRPNWEVINKSDFDDECSTFSTDIVT